MLDVLRGLFAQCETTQVRDQGKGASLFGYTSLYGAVPGGQAEYLRVPQAHFGPIKVPDGTPDERYLFLSDVLPTAWQSVRYADVPEGGTLAVLGLGPIGQMATRIGRHLGAERVIGVDSVDARLQMAARHGVEILDMREVGDVAAALIERTGGRGPDAVIEAVGMEAHGSLKQQRRQGRAVGRRPAARQDGRTGADRQDRGRPAWTRCSPRSRRYAAAGPSRSRACTAARSTRCR